MPDLHIEGGIFHSGGGKQAGFTLIELLVVISLITLLISLLLPVLGQAQRNVQTAQCLANLRMIGVGWSSYSDANRDLIVRSLSSNLNDYDTADGWYQSYCNTSNGRSFAYFLNSYMDSDYDLTSQARTSNVWFCPANRRAGIQVCGPANQPGNYSANGEYASTDRAPLPPRNLRRDDIAKYYTSRPIIFDAIFESATGVSASLSSNPMYRVANYMNPATSLGRWVHSGTINILWADTHASTNLPATISSGIFDYDLYGGWKQGPAYIGAAY